MVINHFIQLRILVLPGLVALWMGSAIANATVPPSPSTPQSPQTAPAPPNSFSQRLQELERLKNQTTTFSDLTPKDWAYEPITTLMQKYGCVSGYPDGTFRGKQPLTRNEFAAGLEACLQRMDKLIQDRTANLVTRDDLATLFRILSTIFDNATPSPRPTPTPNAPTQPPLPSPK